MEAAATPVEEAQRAVDFRIADLRGKDIGKVHIFFLLPDYLFAVNNIRNLRC